MKRIVAFAVAVLIVIIIMGLALNYMKSIQEVNQKRREQEAAKSVAESMAADTSETLNIWEYLRTTEASTEAMETSESGETMTESVEADTPQVLIVPVN